MTATDTNPLTDHEPILPEPDEQAALDDLLQLLVGEDGESLRVLGADGEGVALSASARRVLARAVYQLAEDRAVCVTSFGQTIHPREAADVLGIHISRVMELIQTDELPSVSDDVFHVLPLGAVIAYRRKMKAQQAAGLLELVRLSEEMGLYELEARDHRDNP